MKEKVFNIRHRCFHFSKLIVRYVRNAKYEKVFQSVFIQLVRAGTSIGANIVEGSAGSSKRDFINFYTIALKSANETKYWLCLIRDEIDLENTEQINRMIEEADEVSKIIAKIIINSKN